MFTINLPNFPVPCSHKALAEAIVDNLDRDQCRSLLSGGVLDHSLNLRVIERLGYLADGY